MPPELQGPYVPAMVLFGACTIWGISAAWDLIDALRSYGWPSVPGRTLGHAVSFGASKYAADDSLVIAYTYKVDGVEYRGLRFDYAGGNSLGQSAKLLKRYGPGKRVDVYYDPKNPSRAVLQPGVGSWTVAPLLICAFAIALTGPVVLRAIELLLAR